MIRNVENNLATWATKVRLIDPVFRLSLSLIFVIGGVCRQNIWHNSRRRIAECGPRLGLMFRRRACGVASADVRVSFA